MTEEKKSAVNKSANVSFITLDNENNQRARTRPVSNVETHHPIVQRTEDKGGYQRFKTGIITFGKTSARKLSP